MIALDSLVAKPPPIEKDEDGVYRVGGTRVRLETIIGAFMLGCCPEEIAHKYPTVSLTDIYGVITYFLWHRQEIEPYLQERRQAEEQTRQELTTLFPSGGIRDRLLSRGVAQR